MFPSESFLAAHIQQQCPGVLWAIREAGSEQRIRGYAFHFHRVITITLAAGTTGFVAAAARVGLGRVEIASAAGRERCSELVLR